MTRCIYDHLAAEAYRVEDIDEDRRLIPVDLHLCDWPDQHPERFVDAPSWWHKRIGVSPAISPERDCVGCPARKDEP